MPLAVFTKLFLSFDSKEQLPELIVTTHFRESLCFT